MSTLVKPGGSTGVTGHWSWISEGERVMGNTSTEPS